VNIDAKRWVPLALIGTLVFVVIWATMASAWFLFTNYRTLEGLTPWYIVWFGWTYRATPGVLGAIGEAAMLSGMVTALLPIAVIMKVSKGRALHGAARFANVREIKKANLFAEKGILLGKYRGRYLTLGGNTSVAVGAPTRSGKGVGVVIPNLLNWPDSVVVLDMKKENYEITSGFRSSHGQQVYMFDPGEPGGHTHRWNPLGYVSDQPGQRISDLQIIANLIWPDAPGSDPMWSSSARSLFLGLALYVAERGDVPFTLGEIYRQITGGDDQRFIDEFGAREAAGEGFSATCVQGLTDYCSTNDRTRQSIRKTFTASLELWANPMIDAATAANDFDLRQLRRERISIYVGVAPGDMQRLRMVLNLFFQQVFDLNTRTLPENDATLRYQCLMLHDEFPALGRMLTIANGIAYIGGYGLRMLSVFQSDGQLRARELYGPELTDSFLENHAVRVYFPPKDNRVAKEISDTLGTETVTVKNVTRQVPTMMSNHHGKSISEREESRELLKPQEIRTLPDTKELLIVENCRPIQADKIRYFQDDDFTDRVSNAPPVPKIDVSEFLARPAPSFVESVERPLTEADFGADLALSDFDMDFDSIEVPKGQLDDGAVDDLVSQFMQKVS